MGLWKIIIGDKDSTNLHGVTLREDIKKVALLSAPPIYGQVRNIKETGQVEVICKSAEKPLKFRDAIDEEIKSNHLIIGGATVHDPTYVEDETLKIDDTFKVIREDELTEMTWALRNAGAAVLSQDFIRSKKLIRASIAELQQSLLILADIKSGKKHRKLNLIAIQNLLSEPPEKIPYEMLMELHAIYDDSIELNRNIDDKADKMDTRILMDIAEDLEKRINSIVKKFLYFAGKMNINIGENNTKSKGA